MKKNMVKTICASDNSFQQRIVTHGDTILPSVGVFLRRCECPHVMKLISS